MTSICLIRYYSVKNSQQPKETQNDQHTAHQHATLPQAGTYVIDPAHTEVGFVARHLIGTKVRGRFTEVSGTFTVAEPLEDSTLEAQVAGGQHPHQPDHA